MKPAHRWRRLHVAWPSYLATHSTEQTLYLNSEGLLARHDYDVEISGGTSAAHYVSDYDDVAGIRLPTRHRIFPRNPDGQSLAEPLIVSIDLSGAGQRPSRFSARHHISRPSFAGSGSVVIGAVRCVDHDGVYVHELERAVTEQLSAVARVLDTAERQARI